LPPGWSSTLPPHAIATAVPHSRASPIARVVLMTD
jgi:hypothetical protein